MGYFLAVCDSQHYAGRIREFWAEFKLNEPKQDVPQSGNGQGKIKKSEKVRKLYFEFRKIDILEKIAII